MAETDLTAAQADALSGTSDSDTDLTYPTIGESTYYTYNLRDQLTQVSMTRNSTQQTRTFNYDVCDGRSDTKRRTALDPAPGSTKLWVSLDNADAVIDGNPGLQRHEPHDLAAGRAPDQAFRPALRCLDPDRALFHGSKRCLLWAPGVD